ncbi:MAG: Rrf2 family transcriptional regulator [Planctomycetes bacterium]|nr:Rrf2 family transcriptional regulator [Planctomycetota bacterium]
MAGVLHFGEMAALALHVMGEVARRQVAAPEVRSSVPALAAALDASLHTLHKVVAKLVLAGLLDSARGPAGGVRLQLEATAISLLAVLEAVDGPRRGGTCLLAKRGCADGTACPFSFLTRDLERRAHEYLVQTTVADLATGAGCPPPPSTSTF